MILDTDTLIHLSKSKTGESQKIVAFLENKKVYRPGISVISFIEFLSFHLYTEGERLRLEQYLKAGFSIHPVNEEIASSAIFLRSSYFGRIKGEDREVDLRKGLADFIIMATTLVNQSKILTFDLRYKRMFPEHQECILYGQEVL